MCLFACLIYLTVRCFWELIEISAPFVFPSGCGGGGGGGGGRMGMGMGMGMGIFIRKRKTQTQGPTRKAYRATS
jgi:hypothetical protein